MLIGALVGATPQSAHAQAAVENGPPKPASAVVEELTPAELMNSYRQVREQLQATQLAIANNRLEAETAARAQAIAVAERLEAILLSMEKERERHRTEIERLNTERERQRLEGERATAESNRRQAEADRSTRMVLWIAVAFGSAGLLAVITMPVLQWRTLNRLAELRPHPIALPAGNTHPLLNEKSDEMTSPHVAMSNQRLLSAIDRMEQRIFELEHMTSHPLPSVSANPFIAADPIRHQPMAADPGERIGILLARGRSFLDGNKAREALASFDEVLKHDLNHTEALVRRGAALEQLKQDDEAIQCYDRAIKLDPKMTLAYLHKGGICNRLQRYEEALKCYQQALLAEEEGKPGSDSSPPLRAPWPATRRLGVV